MVSPLFLTLPAELVASIVDCVPIEDLVNLALTCRELHNHLKDILELHQGYDIYRMQHDRVPSTIPGLLRLAINNSAAAWHVRTLDFWGSRNAASKWKTWTVLDHFRSPEEPHEDFSDRLDTLVSPDELLVYERLIRGIIEYSEPDKESSFWDDSWYEWTLDRWMEKLKEGNDAPMKFLLLALLPQLDCVNLLGHGYHEQDWGLWEYPLMFFEHAVGSIHRHPTMAWPQGFASLRRIDILTPIPSPNDYSVFQCDQDSVAPLLLLPKLKILNLSRVSGESGEATSQDPIEGTSSIEELGLYDCDLGDNFWQWILQRPQHLTKLCINSFGELLESIDPDEFLREIGESLVQQYADTLQELDAQDVNMQYQRGFKHLAISDGVCVDDLVVDLNDARTDDEATLKADTGGSGGVHILDLRDFLPPTIKHLSLKIGNCGWDHGPEPLEKLLTMLADFADDPRYLQLKVLCIYDLLPTIKEELDTILESGIYRQAVSRLTGRGITLHHHEPDSEDALDENEHRKLHPSLTGCGQIQTDHSRARRA